MKGFQKGTVAVIELMGIRTVRLSPGKVKMTEVFFDSVAF